MKNKFSLYVVALSVLLVHLLNANNALYAQNLPEKCSIFWYVTYDPFVFSHQETFTKGADGYDICISTVNAICAEYGGNIGRTLNNSHEWCVTGGNSTPPPNYPSLSAGARCLSGALRAVSLEGSDANHFELRVTPGGIYEGAFHQLALQQGSYTLQGQAFNDGGASGWSSVVTVEHDTTAPTTLLELVGVIGNANWYRSYVNATLPSIDSGCLGVSATSYTLNGILNAYTGVPFLITQEGENSLSYFSTDGTHEELPISTFVYVDATPPTLFISPDRAPDVASGWWRSPVTMTVMAFDATSGLASATYTHNGIPSAYVSPVVLDTDDQHQFDVSVFDIAGWETVDGYVIQIDQTPPQLQIIPDRAPDRNGYYLSPVTFEVMATDVTSGIATTVYTLDRATWQAYTTPLVFDQDGKQQLDVVAQDAAEWVTTLSLPFQIDQTPPTVSWVLDRATHNGWVSGTVGASLMASDNLSGITERYYNHNEQGWRSLQPKENVHFWQEGTHTLEGAVVDGAGWQSTARITFQIDLTPPSLGVQFDRSPDEGAAWRNGVGINIVGSDARSGLDRFEFRLNGGDWQIFRGAFWVNSTSLLEARAIDFAGNVTQQTLNLEIVTATDTSSAVVLPIVPISNNPSAPIPPTGGNSWLGEGDLVALDTFPMPSSDSIDFSVWVSAGDLVAIETTFGQLNNTLIETPIYNASSTLDDTPLFIASPSLSSGSENTSSSIEANSTTELSIVSSPLTEIRVRSLPDAEPVAPLPLTPADILAALGVGGILASATLAAGVVFQTVTAKKRQEELDAEFAKAIEEAETLALKQNYEAFANWMKNQELQEIADDIVFLESQQSEANRNYWIIKEQAAEQWAAVADWIALKDQTLDVATGLETQYNSLKHLLTAQEKLAFEAQLEALHNSFATYNSQSVLGASGLLAGGFSATVANAIAREKARQEAIRAEEARQEAIEAKKKADLEELKAQQTAFIADKVAEYQQYPMITPPMRATFDALLNGARDAVRGISQAFTNFFSFVNKPKKNQPLFKEDTATSVETSIKANPHNNISPKVWAGSQNTPNSDVYLNVPHESMPEFRTYAIGALMQISDGFIDPKWKLLSNYELKVLLLDEIHKQSENRINPFDPQNGTTWADIRFRITENVLAKSLLTQILENPKSVLVFLGAVVMTGAILAASIAFEPVDWFLTAQGVSECASQEDWGCIGIEAGLILLPGAVGKAGDIFNATRNFLNGSDAVTDVARGIDKGIDVVEGIDDTTDAVRYLDCSFTPNTLVTTPNGSYPIMSLSPHDTVLAYHEAHGQVGTYPITASFSHVDDEIVYLTIDGELILTTPEHPFFTRTGWQTAGSLTLADDVFSLSGDWGDIDSISVVHAPQRMYNLTVDDAHTFAVGRGQWVVHNDCRPIYPDGEIPKPGTEHIVRVVNSSENFYESYGYARNLAKNFIGDLGDDAIDFVSGVGPMKGRVVGRQTADESRGWRVDWDSNKGFHVNWWDYTGGNKRAQQTYGAVIVEGATYDNYLEILKHFPSN